MIQNRPLRHAKIALHRRARHLRRDTRALAMIEMAVTLPTLLLLSFGGLEISSLMLAHTRQPAKAFGGDAGGIMVTIAR